MATRRKTKKAAEKPLSKRALRAQAEKRKEASRRGWETRKANAALKAEKARRRSEASKRGWETRRVKKAPEKLSKIRKAELAKRRAIEKKVEFASLPKNSRIYDDAERAADKARIKELEEEKAALVKQITDRYDTSQFRDVLPPEYLNEGSFTIALFRSRLRHTAESEEIQEIFAQAYEDGGEAKVFKIAHKLLEQFQADHEDYNWDWWTDDDPLTFQELISLYFSP